MSAARLLVALVLVAATVTLAASVPAPAADSLPIVEVPFVIGSWQGGDAGPVDAETEEAVAADRVVNRTYVDPGGKEAGLYIAYYNSQRPGVSIHSPLHCLPGTGWDVVSNEIVEVGLPAGNTGHARRLIAQKASSRIIVLYWYSIQGEMIASEMASRVQLLTNRLRTGRNDAALVRIAIPVMDSDAAAERRGLAFVNALVPHLL
jgi:EpsI family protein